MKKLLQNLEEFYKRRTTSRSRPCRRVLLFGYGKYEEYNGFPFIKFGFGPETGPQFQRLIRKDLQPKDRLD